MSSEAEVLILTDFVWGAGALGLYLAHKMSCPVLYRTAPTQPILIGQQTFHGNLTDRLIPAKNLWICTGIQDLDTVLQTLHQHSHRFERVIFCQNGLLPLDELKKIKITSIFRVLFYLGVRKQTSEGGTKIIWGGGNSFVGAALKGTPKPPPQIPDLQFFPTEDIIKQQLLKAFANFILAKIIGPNLLQNKEILKDEYKEILKHWAQIFQKNFAISAEEFLANATHTAKETQNNINSFSLSWYNGNLRPFQELCRSLKNQAACPEDFKDL